MRGGRKELPAGVTREYSSYCGNYTYDGEKLVTRVDAASDPSRIGSDQVRGVRFEGARMILIPPARRIGESENTARSPGSGSRWNNAQYVSSIIGAEMIADRFAVYDRSKCAAEVARMPATLTETTIRKPDVSDLD